jgi:hypothetical protein
MSVKKVDARQSPERIETKQIFFFVGQIKKSTFPENWNICFFCRRERIQGDQMSL